MSLTTKSVVVAAALTLAATPAFALDGSNNPGTSYQQANQPAGTPKQTSNPGTTHQPSGTPTQTDNPGTSHVPPMPSEARALGRTNCAEFKTKFKENRSAFGKCIAAVAKALRNESASAKSVCGAANLTRKRLDGQKRSDFKACVLAVARARQGAANSDS